MLIAQDYDSRAGGGRALARDLSLLFGSLVGVSTAARERSCPRCAGSPLNPASYGYLLGLYLGDGCLSRQGQSSWKLRIVQDSRYPGLVVMCKAAMASVFDAGRIREVVRGGFIEIHSSWQHWICLFPQHGPGRKHSREVKLELWQTLLLSGCEKELVAGLIHSDGSRHLNRVRRPLASGDRVYEYPRYQFNNRSVDITAILTNALEAIGVGWSKGGKNSISIARRADVAFLDEFVAPKE